MRLFSDLDIQNKYQYKLPIVKQVSPAEIKALNPAVYSVEEETGLFRW